jgi:GNAT superfamily N-acetyltransferase
MGIKTATISDAKEMQRLHTSAVRTTCKDFYNKKQIDAWLEGRSPEGFHEGINNGDMFIAEENGKILGFGHAIPSEIVAVFVDPAFHGQGVGKLLLDYGLKIALNGHQKVKAESTINAEGFYAKHGFKKLKESSVTRRGVEIPIIVMEYSAR